jgi:hypothetical protein
LLSILSIALIISSETDESWFEVALTKKKKEDQDQTVAMIAVKSRSI